MSFAAELLAEFDADVAAGAEAVFTDYRDLVRAAPTTPRASGNLAAGIEIDPIETSPAGASTDLKSTATTESGADYGTILDRSTGRVVEAADYGHRAFGPIAAAGGPSFIRRFRVTTAHVGWWEQSANEILWAQSAAALDRYNL